MLELHRGGRNYFHCTGNQNATPIVHNFTDVLIFVSQFFHREAFLDFAAIEAPVFEDFHLCIMLARIHIGFDSD